MKTEALRGEHVCVSVHVYECALDGEGEEVTVCAAAPQLKILNNYPDDSGLYFKVFCLGKKKKKKEIRPQEHPQEKKSAA